MQIPYVPTPLEDEVLGSWVARLKLHNGEAVWRELWDRAGYAKQQSSLFRIPDHSPKLERLLDLMGMTFETALLKHTHLPYVMAFQDVEHRGMGSDQGPVKKNKQVQRQALLRGRQTAPRFCPECIEDDFQDGEPRWRLTHQLPNVFYCSRHSTRLRSSCDACGRVVGNAGDELVPPLPVECRCGEPLGRRRKPSQPEPDLHRAVRKASIDALRHGKGTWSGAQMRAHVENLLAEHMADAAPSVGYARFLQDGLPGYRSEHAGTRTLFHHDATGTAFEMNVDWKLARAPELCALLAFLGRDFLADAQSLAQVAVRPRKKRVEVTDDTMRAELALFLRRRAAGEPAYPSMSLPYWYFRMKDPAYLEQQCPEVPLSRIPTVLEDRETMRKRMGNLEDSPVKVLARMGSTQALAFRVRLRDNEWLERTKADLLVRRAALVRTNRTQALTQAQLEPVRLAIQRMTAPGIRPVRLATKTIGREAKMPIHTVDRVLKGSDELSELVERWNDGFIANVLDWTASVLHQSGKQLSTTPLCRTAGITLSAKNMDAAEEAIKRYASRHALLPGQYQLREVRRVKHNIDAGG